MSNEKLTGLEQYPLGNCEECGFPLAAGVECLNAECSMYAYGCGQCCSLCKKCTGGCAIWCDDMCMCQYEYRPLADLIREGLEPGTVLALQNNNFKHTWDGQTMMHDDGDKWETNPFDYQWRIVSTPPKRREFETHVCKNAIGLYVFLPERTEFELGLRVKVTIEEVQK